MIIEINPLKWFGKGEQRTPVKPLVPTPPARKEVQDLPSPQATESKPAEAVESSDMANILVDIEKGIEIAAEDVLKVVTWVGKEAPKVEAAEPKVVAALGVLLGAVNKSLVSVEGAVAAPLSIPLDVATLASLKAVWPDVTAFLATLGIKL